MIEAIYWDTKQECLKILDQLRLPQSEEYLEAKNLEDIIKSIKEMNVRGAPAIGYTGIYGVAFLVRDLEKALWKQASEKLKKARPTAVNLAYEVDEAMDFIEKKRLQESSLSRTSLFSDLLDYAQKVMDKAEVDHQRMAHWTEVVLDKLVKKKSFRLQTHCNTGRLACGVLGTALGAIERLNQKKKLEKVWIDETRPYLQGSRLTAFELQKMGADFDIVVEGAAGYLISQGYVDAVLVGADRIAANGDTANKIGTLNLAIICQRCQIPFLVLAPISSFDLSISSGVDIEVEVRDQKEVLGFGSQQVAPIGASAFNPSFDITTSELITAIICEKGIIENPSANKLKWFFEKLSES